MPTYDYVCQACHHEMEAFQSMTAKPLRKCPECGKLKLKRLIGTGAGVIFKGSGFYETDYRSESYKKGEKAEAESTKKSDEKGKDTKEKTPAKSESSGVKAESKSKSKSKE